MALLAFKKAVRGVVREHRKAGLSLPIWKNGKVVRISPFSVK
jgi:hypothetical protein